VPDHGRARRGQSRDGQRFCDARGLKPHRVETFKLPSDPQFEDKLIDDAGLYISPPDKAARSPYPV
jgi:hypothetical protein